jgi:hypothetical protein
MGLATKCYCCLLHSFKKKLGKKIYFVLFGFPFVVDRFLERGASTFEYFTHTNPGNFDFQEFNFYLQKKVTWRLFNSGTRKFFIMMKEKAIL